MPAACVKPLIDMAEDNRKDSKKPRKGAVRIDPMRCPPGMTLEEWQRQLRRAAAGKENFGIEPPCDSGDPFIVSSAKSGRKYCVEYYGRHSAYNRCECMDFRTSGLGICKHLEAVAAACDEKRIFDHAGAPRHSGVYVDYTDGRKIKFRSGAEFSSSDMTGLIRKYFDSDGVLKDITSDPTELMHAFRAVDETFEWEPDALNLIIEARDRQRREEIIRGKYVNSYFDGLLKITLHPYQADGVRFAFVGGRTINADEMGLGKTVQAIATAELLKKEGFVHSVLIICPTSLKYQWLSEIRRFTDSSAVVIEGNLLKRRDMMRDPSVFYKICSFQSMSNNIKAGYIPEVDMVIYDELQRLKNRETQMGKQLRKLSSQYVMALSGTPLENHLEELYSVTQLVDQYVFGALYKFVADTILRDDNGKIVGYKNLHAIADRLKGTLIRRKKSDVKLQMPARTDTNLFVPMTKEQRAIHDDYKNNVAQIIYKWRRWRFLSEKDRKRLLLFLSMMRMVCDSTYILDQKSRYDTKVDEIMAIITSLLSSEEEKVVIFSQWERMLRIIARELEAEGIDFCFLHGGVPSPKRKNLIDSFRDDPECRIFLSTDAGSTGLNLQTASLLINVDLPWNPAVLEQRIARIYRLGQQNPVQIINMIARDTIEERMLSTLNFKANLAAGILDGGDDAVFLESKKFDKIVEMVDNIVSEGVVNTPVVEEATEDINPQVVEEQSDEHPAADSETPVPEAEAAGREQSPSARPSTTVAPQPSGPEPATKPKESTPQTPDEMRELVANGIQLLGNLANALRNPESARAMADAIVREDPVTGSTSLNIPVPDKTTVVNLLSAFSALLGNTVKK